MAPDADQLLQAGRTYAKNAEDALARKVKREDQLYLWDNQVEVLDGFLADSEDLADGNAELAELRDRARTLKHDLETGAMAFLAEQEGEEPPEDPSSEEWAAMFVDTGPELRDLADEALDSKVNEVGDLSAWEGPLASINSFLADSEVHVAAHPDLAGIRVELKERKLALEERIDDIVTRWRLEDQASGR